MDTSGKEKKPTGRALATLLSLAALYMKVDAHNMRGKFIAAVDEETRHMMLDGADHFMQNGVPEFQLKNGETPLEAALRLGSREALVSELMDRYIAYGQRLANERLATG